MEIFLITQPISSHFTGEETPFQGDDMTYAKSHSMFAAEAGCMCVFNIRLNSLPTLRVFPKPSAAFWISDTPYTIFPQIALRSTSANHRLLETFTVRLEKELNEAQWSPLGLKT